MRINKALPIVAAAIASPCFVARAFSTSTGLNSPSVLSNGVSATALPRVSTPSFLARGGAKDISTTSLSLFDKLFGGSTGGGFGAKIDYTAIPYPVPDLALLASAGVAGEELVRDGKTYKLATFAGGCFWGVELYYQRIPGVEYSGVVRYENSSIDFFYICIHICIYTYKHFLYPFGVVVIIIFIYFEEIL